MNNQNIKASPKIIEQIPVSKLDEIISGKKYKIIDVRNEQGIKAQGAIPDALNIPFDSIGKSIDTNDKNYNLVFNSNGPFLFCCTGGVMSYIAAIKAQEYGIQNVYNLEGGHAAWMKHKDEIK